MKVGIDASRAFIKERTGTEVYAYELIKKLTKINSPFCQFFLYLGSEEKVDFELPENFQVRRIDRKKFFTQVGLSKELLKDLVDVLFIPSHSVPFIHPTKTVVTIHGLEYINYPQCYSPKGRFLLEVNSRYSAAKASSIIAPSEATKNDLVKYYKVRVEKIIVIPHGAGEMENEKPNIEDQNPQTGNSNILFIGRIEKRKNIVNLIKAFNILKSGKDNKMKNCKLILAGKPGFGYMEIVAEANDSAFKDDIILPFYVGEKEKAEFFRSAYVFVMPSLAEGFGLPILEAQNRNVPVLCSDIPPFSEIGKDSVLYFNPVKFADMAEKIGTIFNDRALRESLIKKGSENVKDYSWEKCAEETLKVLIS